MNHPKFKIGNIHPWKKIPVYVVLVFNRKGKGWFPLTLSDGSPARFNKPPRSAQEALEAIKEYEVINHD